MIINQRKYPVIKNEIMKKQFENAVLIAKCLKLYTIEMFVLQNNKNKFIL